jgi:hypothetical protein
MATKWAYTFVVLCLFGMAMTLSSPHKGMINMATIRDVGMTYPEAKFKDDANFLFEV